jgi:hypothetical protein
MQVIGEHFRERAVDNTPIDTSDLRNSIKPEVTQKGGSITLDVTANTRYAQHVHENFVGAQGGTIQARLRQSTPEGIVGGWYLSRVGMFHIDRYLKFMRQAIRRGVKSKTGRFGVGRIQ